MRGIINLKSPLESDFEGISEIKKYNDEEQDIHDFPMTTKFINMEFTRSRAGTNKKNLKIEELNLDNSDSNLKNKKEELSKLFKNKMNKDLIESSEINSKKFDMMSPDSLRVILFFIFYLKIKTYKCKEFSIIDNLFVSFN